MRANLDWEDILSSLRNGVIPSESIEFFEVGRDYEVSQFKSILNSLKSNSKSVTKFISGEYGDGKSFILKVVSENAYDNNFVVSNVTISHNISFDKIDEIYKNILRNLKVKNTNSFAEIVNTWITKLNREASKKYPNDISRQNKFVEEQIYSTLNKVKSHNPTFAEIIKKFYEFSYGSKSDIAEYGLNWITGDVINQSIKKEFGLTGDIKKSEILDYIKTLSIFFKSIGYSGFVVLFDECEITMDIQNTHNRNIAYNNIRDIYDKKFESTLFVFAGIPLWFENTEKGIKSNPALYDRIKDPIINRNVRVQKPVINLSKFSENELYKLFRKISNVYEKVYGTKSVNKLSPYLEYVVEPYLDEGYIDNASLRDFIREYIAFLDVVRENPEDYVYRQDFIDLLTGENDDWY